jgi:tetratricopeptide (TPR) repeat protein
MARNLVALIGSALASHGQTATDIGHVIASDLQAGKYDEAKELAEQALKNAPNDARLWTLEGITLFRLQHENEGLAAFRHALKLAPNYLPALEGAAEIEYQTDKDNAAPLLRSIVKLRPDDRTAHAMLADIAFRQGDCGAAREEYAKSQAASASDLGPLEEFGACLVKQKQTAEALPVFARLSELQPGNNKAVYDLAVAQFLTGRYAEVVKTLSSPTRKDAPDSDSLDLLAEAYESMSDTEHAVTTLRQAIAANPDVPKYYADLAYIHLEHRQFEQGLAVVNGGLRRIPNAASLYVARGLLFSELAQYDKGLSDFDAAERLDPNVELSSEARVLANVQQNDLPKAERTVRERIRQHPANAFLYYVLGETLRKKGAAPGSAEFDEAVNALRKSLELDPNSNLSRDLLAALYLQSGNIEGALEQSRIAYRINPADEGALYHLIVALRKSGKTDEIPGLVNELSRLKKLNGTKNSLEQKYTSVDQPIVSSKP